MTPCPGSGTRGNEPTWPKSRTDTTTAQATPASKTARATQYQTRPGRIFAGGMNVGATFAAPPPVGGPEDVAMIRPLPSVARCWLQHNEESRANGPDQRHKRANSQSIPPLSWPGTAANSDVTGS